MPLGKYCLFETVRIFVGAPLPWATGVRKVHLDAGINGELFVSADFFSLVVGQRFGNFCGQATEFFGVRLADALGVFGFQRNKDRVASSSFHEGADGCLFVLADDQVAFPVTGNCPVGNLGRTLFNGQHVGYFAAHFDDVAPFLGPSVFAFLA